MVAWWCAILYGRWVAFEAEKPGPGARGKERASATQRPRLVSMQTRRRVSRAESGETPECSSSPETAETARSTSSCFRPAFEMPRVAMTDFRSCTLSLSAAACTSRWGSIPMHAPSGRPTLIRRSRVRMFRECAPSQILAPPHPATRHCCSPWRSYDEAHLIALYWLSLCSLKSIQFINSPMERIHIACIPQPITHSRGCCADAYVLIACVASSDIVLFCLSASCCSNSYVSLSTPTLGSRTPLPPLPLLPISGSGV